ncbi:MAG: SLATT domain-containing protein [Staphylococcus equorum]|nr:SLATT domain-containing protein [Tetragenococcus koreensis]MDN6722608.1 SLATT domain-containing protein [Staphylococcus equorum]
MDSQKKKLEVQLRESYGKVTYTYTSHLKFMERIDKRNRYLKYLQIFLSAVTTGGLLGTMIFNENILIFVAGLFSTISLGINLYFKDFNLSEKSKQHQVASDKLWLIREKYATLLTDLEVLSLEKIMLERDKLRDKTHKIYVESPKTDEKSYAKTQNVLKKEEEQFFEEKELDQMLPKHLRKDRK